MTIFEEDKISISPIVSASELEAAKEIYLEAFPPAEQRSWDMIEARCGGKLTLWGIYLNGQIVGMMTTWQFPEFMYVEHFVVDARLRGRRIGSSAIRILERHCAPMPILLEVEPEHLSAQAQSRIQFYQRLGFHVIDRSYVQPPYDSYLPPVHLWLMATDATISPDKASTLLHRVVYGVTEE